MSYRAKEQELENPIDKIIEGFNEFETAMNNRVESEDWEENHLKELSKLNEKMKRLEFKLKILKKHTW